MTNWLIVLEVAVVLAAAFVTFRYWKRPLPQDLDIMLSEAAQGIVQTLKQNVEQAESRANAAEAEVRRLNDEMGALTTKAREDHNEQLGHINRLELELERQEHRHKLEMERLEMKLAMLTEQMSITVNFWKNEARRAGSAKVNDENDGETKSDEDGVG